MNAKYMIERLGPDHLVEEFDCGVPSLTDWLRLHSKGANKRGTARVFVLHEGDFRVLGYLTLSPHLIRKDELSSRLGRGNPNQIPSLLLGKLALDISLHGKGLGGALLTKAFQLAALASQQIGGRFLVVDAIDESATAFYGKYGFEVMDDNPLRLVRKISDIIAELDQA